VNDAAVLEAAASLAESVEPERRAAHLAPKLRAIAVRLERSNEGALLRQMRESAERFEARLA
jgi:hypothetical protein